VPASRDSQSSVTAKPSPSPALAPTPTMWLNPTPFGPDQSSTARHSEADCDTSARRPARGGRWASEAFSPIAGTHNPNEFGPIARTPVASPASRSAACPPGIAEVTSASVVPRRPSAASAGATSAAGRASTARSAASGSAATSSAVSARCTLPGKRARLAARRAPSAVPDPSSATLRGRNSRSGRSGPGSREGGVMPTAGQEARLGSAQTRQGRAAPGPA